MENFLEIINDYPRKLQIPFSGNEIKYPILVKHINSVLLCGGFFNKGCLKLENGSLKLHSILNRERSLATAVTINSEVFIFGGPYGEDTYEYLPKDSSKWILGKGNMPENISDAVAVANESKQEILLIGGRETYKRILKFNVKEHTFEELSTKLIFGRYGHRCAFIPGTKKIIITGGCNLEYSSMSSTEILDTENYSITMAQNQMDMGRSHHGIGIITINDEERLAVFGGIDVRWGTGPLNSVEIYNANTQKWEMSDMKFSGKRYAFGFLNVKLKDVSKLRA